jgi:hypothetical protein
VPGLWLMARLIALTGERLALNRLGAAGSPLAVAVVAYGGGALVLLPLAWTVHGNPVNPAALLPGVVYTASFMLYTGALAMGPLSVVAPWPAVTALLLWLWHPVGGVVALMGVGMVVGGGFVASGRGSGRPWGPILLMVGSDVFLAAARLLDQERSGGALFAYAFTLYAVVGGLLTGAALLVGQTRAVGQLVRRAPGWALSGALANGGAYVTVVALLRHWPPYLVEALSGWAGVSTVAVAVFGLREGDAWRKLAGAAAMTVGAGILALMHGALTARW